MLETPQITPAPQPPSNIYYEAPAQPPLSNGTAHIEEPEIAVAPKEEPAPVAIAPVEEEPKEVFEPPQPTIPEVPAEPEREPTPEPEPQAKSKALRWLNWSPLDKMAAILQTTCSNAFSWM